ncbi:MAG: hypothetical protein ACRCUY_11175 [Thermoguttaceae bacterium]
MFLVLAVHKAPPPRLLRGVYQECPEAISMSIRPECPPVAWIF